MSLTFPHDLSSKYYFDLKFVTYSRPDPFSGKINLSYPSWGGAPGYGSIRLPVPAHMMDSQNLRWTQESRMDGYVGAAMELANQDVRGMALINAMLQQSGGLSQMLNNFTSTGDIQGYLLQNAGLALNPVLTQTFKHPEFKTHQFSWKLAPENPEESLTLQGIIDAIKLNSLPDISLGGAFFSYPSIALIRIHSGNNGDLYNFQPAVITNVTVHWAPQGVPSFLAGTNAPTSVQIDISLLEIILNTRKNYTGENVVGTPPTPSSGFNLSLGAGNILGNLIQGRSAINQKLSATLSDFLRGK